MPIDGPPISSQDQGNPDQEADHREDRDRVHGPRVARMGVYVDSLEQLDHERDGQPDQEQPITHGGPPHLTQPDQRQQRRHHEREPDDRHAHRCPPDLVSGDQGEQRYRQRVGERRQRRHRAYAVQLSPLLGAGKPIRGNRNGHGQRPNQRPGHACAGREEVMNARRNHLVILAAAAGGRAPAAQEGPVACAAGGEPVRTPFSQDRGNRG